MTTRKVLGGAGIAATLAVAAAPAPVMAQAPAATTVAPAPPAAPAAAAPAAAAAPPPGFWIDGIHLSAQIDAGISFNPAGPKQNFGQWFSDHPNQPLLNQLLLTANKPLDPKATGFDWGFKLQFMYGSDARYTHFLGELDRALPNDRNQLDLIEANVLLHLPYLTSGGIDIKAGQYPTPLGFETIDPSTNPFYSHSYIFTFGLPYKHTGVLTTTHVNPLLDVYLGVDSGVNTTFGPLGDNNSAIAFLGGAGLNMMDGALTVLALTHIGPENPTRTLSPLGYNADGYYRYLNDVIVTYKATDKLTLVTEANFARDDAGGGGAPGNLKPANAFGIAQYASYALNEQFTLNGRAEFFRDDNNFFVAAFGANNGYDNLQKGFPTAVITAPHPTSYGEITLGVVYKPANMPAAISGLLVRPEVRYDRALTNTHPYNSGRDNGSFTIASDVVLTF